MASTIDRTKLTPPELARKWGVSVNKVLAFIRTGELRAVNFASSRCNRPRYLIDLADIERFEQARQVAPDGGLSATQRLRRKAAGNIREYF